MYVDKNSIVTPDGTELVSLTLTKEIGGFPSQADVYATVSSIANAGVTVQASQVIGLASVATSGAYSSLTGTPTIQSSSGASGVLQASNGTGGFSGVTGATWDSTTLTLPSTTTFANLKVISTNTTWTVKASGGDYTTIAAAVAASQNVIFTNNASLTINIDPGTYSISSSISLWSPYGDQISILGAAPTAVNITSVQSSSGSAGAWSIVLNVNTVAGISVNQYIGISSPSGGVNPSYLAGGWKITNVDVGNTRITVASTHQAASAPSGAVTATGQVFTTQLNCTGCSGFKAYDNRTDLILGNIAIIGDASGGYCGVDINDTCVGWAYAPWLISGFGGDGIRLSLNSKLDAQTTNVFSCSNGLCGLGAYTGSQVAIPQLYACGNTQSGVQARNASILASTGTASGNGLHGYYALLSGFIQVSTNVATGNTSNGFCSVDTSLVTVYAPNGTLNSFTATGNGSNPYFIQFGTYPFTVNQTGAVTCGAVTSSGTLTLPNSTYSNSGAGNITKGLYVWAHDFNYGNNGTVTTDGNNTFVGNGAGNFTMGSTAVNTYDASTNTGVGNHALSALTTGYGNASVGNNALKAVTTAIRNTAIGDNAGGNLVNGNYNVLIGNGAGAGAGAGNNTYVGTSVAIGVSSKFSADGVGNETVIGYAATGNGTNTVTLGNTSATGIYMGATKLLGTRITGYGTPTGNANQGSFAAGSITLPNLAAAVAQLIIDLKTHGLLGA